MSQTDIINTDVPQWQSRLCYWQQDMLHFSTIQGYKVEDFRSWQLYQCLRECCALPVQKADGSQHAGSSRPACMQRRSATEGMLHASRGRQQQLRHLAASQPAAGETEAGFFEAVLITSCCCCYMLHMVVYATCNSTCSVQLC